VAFLLIPIFVGNLEAIHSIYIFGDIVYPISIIIFLIFLFFFIKPDGFNKLLNWLLRKLKREPVDYRPDLKNRILIFLYYMISWLLFGFAFFYFLKALKEDSLLSLDYAIGTYIAAYVLGYIAFLSPGGLGFREGVMTVLLSPFFGLPVAVSISLIHRIWITAVEAIISLIALLTYRFGRNTQE